MSMTSCLPRSRPSMGLAFAASGFLYPAVWHDAAVAGRRTDRLGHSNVLFGRLQRIPAHQLGLSPVLMAAANSSGGVMAR